jgi:hypothetical protein
VPDRPLTVRLGLNRHLRILWQNPQARRAAICVAAGIAAVAIGKATPYHRFLAAQFFTVIGLWAGVVASQLRGGWRDAMTAVAALSVALSIAEFALTLAAPIRNPPAQYSVHFVTGHPVLGFAPLPSKIVKAVRHDTAGRTIFDITYTTDEHGLRRTVSNPDAPTVAFFFDSGMFGEGLDDSATLPQQFADLTPGKYHVVNLGFIGYGPQTMLRTLETGFRDDLLVPAPAFFVMQTGLWHADQVACRADFSWQTPRYMLIGGKPVYRGFCAGPWERWALYRLEQSHLYERLVRPWLIDRRADIELYLSVLNEAVAIARQRYGVPTIILYLRTGDSKAAEIGFSDDQVIDRLREGGAIVVDVGAAEQGETDLTIFGDGHPTAKTNRLRAALLRDTIAKIEALNPDRH